MGIRASALSAGLWFALGLMSGLAAQEEALSYRLSDDLDAADHEHLWHADHTYVSHSAPFDAGFPDEPCDAAGGLWNVGAELTFLKPHFEGNRAFTTLASDGVSFETLTDTEFRYDYELAPRAWLEYQTCSGIGVRSRFWNFEQAPTPQAARPPANGFGRIIHPPFGAVDITTTVPTETFRAASGLEAYAIDLEITKSTDFHWWRLLASAGLRYASIDQDYRAELLNAAGARAGAIDYSHNIEGIGITFAVETRRQLGRLAVFANARGSLLFGDARSTLLAGEDLDLMTPFLTDATTSRDDLLPIGELQFGGEIASAETALGVLFARFALEAQYWAGVGNASSEDGNLGFFGATVGAGLLR